MNITIHPVISMGTINANMRRANNNAQATTCQEKKLKELSKHHYPLVYFTGKKPKASDEELKHRSEFQQKQKRAVEYRSNMSTLLQMLNPLENADQITIKGMDKIKQYINENPEQRRLNSVSKGEEIKFFSNIDFIEDSILERNEYTAAEDLKTLGSPELNGYFTKKFLNKGKYRSEVNPSVLGMALKSGNSYLIESALAYLSKSFNSKIPDATNNIRKIEDQVTRDKAIELFSTNENSAVRLGAAQNITYASEEKQANVLATLSKDATPEVRAAVARTCKELSDSELKYSLLENLTKDYNSNTKIEALKSAQSLKKDALIISIIEDTSQSYGKPEYKRLAGELIGSIQNAENREEILNDALNSDNIDYKLGAIKNLDKISDPNKQKEIILKLAKDKNLRIKYAIGANLKNIPNELIRGELIKQLSYDNSYRDPDLHAGIAASLESYSNKEEAKNIMEHFSTLEKNVKYIYPPGQQKFQSIERLKTNINNVQASIEEAKAPSTSDDQESFNVRNNPIKNKAEELNEIENESGYFKTLSSTLNEMSIEKGIPSDPLFKMFSVFAITGQDGCKFENTMNDYKDFKQFAEKNLAKFDNVNTKTDETYFNDNSDKIVSALIIGGKDSLIQRFNEKRLKFDSYLDAINNISKDKNLTSIISDLCLNSKINKHKPLTQDKIELIKLSNAYLKSKEKENLLNTLQGMQQDKVLNLDKLKKIYLQKIFTKDLVMTDEELNQYPSAHKKWDLKYIHTLSIRNHLWNYGLADLVKVTVKDTYKDFIKDEKIELGKINKQTEEDLNAAGLNFDIWMNNGEKVKPVTFKHNNENYEISLWKRNPGHDLFIGSYGGTCIALNGENPKGIIDALLYTMTQFAEIKNKGKTVGYARCYWANSVNPEEEKLTPALIIDNIHYKDKQDPNKENLIKPISDFMQQYGKQVAGKPVKIYLSADANLISDSDNPKIRKEKTDKINIKVIGNTTDDHYYLNSINDTSWCDIKKTHDGVEFYELSKIYPLDEKEHDRDSQS